ncbi:SWI/SNF complex subunit SWI3C-like isoform X1 [Camellia sinensis]|uniref:SWI/SNF complex subunit SWI3C-like isoform X1 n=1 Tax=Camellia sinensis TaxID=4442 RepID=UPI001035FA91|nr:SWI/SNF complex subunit SWI3C-like isoform X1 [Camellia sinensis]
MLRLAHRVGSLVASSRNPPTVLRLASPPPQPLSSSSTSSNPLRMNMESTRNSEGSSHGENTNSSQQKEDNLEVHGQWNQNGEAAPLTAEKVRSAAKAGLAAAATKAKLFADHEEREIQRLSANIINHQAKKTKRKHFIEGISRRINCHLWVKEWKK